VLFIGYFGIKQVGIFTNPRLSPAAVPTPEASMEIPSALSEPPETSVSESFPEKLKYEKNALPAAQLQELHEQLKQLMQTQQPYSNPELTLAQLAQQLEVHPNTLSQVINTCEQKNFFDYINGHRVAAFQQLVQAPGSQQFTLLSLAYECGFNSKTSFNRNFKKVTGLSPTDYLKEQQINLS
jgi:AraC-like DNA-binding protein